MLFLKMLIGYIDELDALTNPVPDLSHSSDEHCMYPYMTIVGIFLG